MKHEVLLDGKPLRDIPMVRSINKFAWVPTKMSQGWLWFNWYQERHVLEFQYDSDTDENLSHWVITDRIRL